MKILKLNSYSTLIPPPPPKKGEKTEAKIHVQANKNFQSLLSLG